MSVDFSCQISTSIDLSVSLKHLLKFKEKQRGLFAAARRGAHWVDFPGGVAVVPVTVHLRTRTHELALTRASPHFKVTRV